MDDLITGADSLDELITLKNAITRILKGGGFELRKYENKMLAIIWSSHHDSLKYLNKQ